MLALTESVPADVSELVGVSSELRRCIRGLPEVDAAWRDVLDELWCDVQVHVAGCAGRAGVDGVLCGVDATAVRHTFDHIREVCTARVAGDPVPLESFSPCRCAAGEWLRSPVEFPTNVAAWDADPNVRAGRPGARWWRWVLGVVGLLGLVLGVSVLAVAVDLPWLPAVVGGLSVGVFTARKSGSSRRREEVVS